jgi:hypothetical protein
VAASLLPNAPTGAVRGPGDIIVLKQCKSLQNVNFYDCDEITGKRATLACGGSTLLRVWGWLPPPPNSLRFSAQNVFFGGIGGVRGVLSLGPSLEAECSRRWPR